MLRRFVLVPLLLLTGFQVEWDPRVGDTVLALWEPNEVYYVATVVQEDRAQALVVYEDGDQAWVTSRQLRPMTITRGSAVLARWTDGKYYPGKVQRIVGRALLIAFDDGEEGWTSWAGVGVRD